MDIKALEEILICFDEQPENEDERIILINERKKRNKRIQQYSRLAEVELLRLLLTFQRIRDRHMLLEYSLKFMELEKRSEIAEIELKRRREIAELEKRSQKFEKDIEIVNLGEKLVEGIDV
jgi:type I restriction-modification system DNA methylase subunit